ncbi:DUF5590 domain-containing protein [Domibacillus enclensis]|uniref:Uncharacterized protein YpmB n=1 Tax=Domibacillus enclensis TaxID=1017273 RepID=A0A1N6P5Z4_9BACI|nr:DUF5590 domain-containing protein [Domibacillus enclensis]OXS80250.1 hypothetical protein B1B05_01895 [Domibacillus enclensis]SIP99673.1 Uncharacterized protein YpmB [Domibacillus enclensis]
MRTTYKKWALIIGIPVLIIAIAVIILYNNAQKPYEEAKERAARQLEEKASLSQTDDVYVYHSTETVYAATGQDQNGQNVAVWLSEKEGSEPVVRPLEEGVTEKEARALFREEAGDAALLSVTLGMEQKTPVWLFLFENENGRLNYYYLSFTDGTWWKKVENI